MSNCELALSFDVRELVSELAKHCEIEFSNEESKPKDVEQIIKASHFILDSLINELKKHSKDQKILAIFAHSLGFQKFLDKEQAIEDLLKDSKADSETKDLLRNLLKELVKRADND